MARGVRLLLPLRVARGLGRASRRQWPPLGQAQLGQTSQGLVLLALLVLVLALALVLALVLVLLVLVRPTRTTICQ